MMRNLIVVFFLLLSFYATAQTEKKTFLLGGNLSYQTADGNDVLLVNPSIGYFIKNNLALGVNAMFLSNSGQNSYSFGPFASYYFGRNAKGKFYVTGGVGLMGDKIDGAIYFAAGGGYAFFLNNSIALNMGLNYLNAGENAAVVAVGAGFQIHFKK